jgi:hypothetical protein
MDDTLSRKSAKKQHRGNDHHECFKLGRSYFMFIAMTPNDVSATATMKLGRFSFAA